jgi:excisionase family DNA binding protein
VEEPIGTAGAAKVLGVSERTITRLRERGVIKAKKVGGRWKFSEKKLRAMVETEGKA